MRRLADGSRVPEPKKAEKWEGIDVYNYTLTEENWLIVLYGNPDNPKQGGHLSGVGRIGKTETPATVTEGLFRQAITQTIKAPQVVAMWGTTLRRWREVNGIIYCVDTYEAAGCYHLAHAMPVCGNGVVRNTANGSQVAVPLDWSRIEGQNG